MIYENEVVMFIIASCVLVITLKFRLEIKFVPQIKLLLAGFYVYYLGWIFTIAEGFFLPDFLNFMEHFAYVVGSLLIAVWCLKISSKTI